MKKITSILLISILFFSCKDEPAKGKFNVTGELKNVPDQKIFLEQLYFSQKPPEIIDTAEIKNGKFIVTGTASEEGMFRLRTEKSQAGFVFINDKAEIKFNADINDISLAGPSFQTPANMLLKQLIMNLQEKGNPINSLNAKIDSLPVGDSLLAGYTSERDEAIARYKNYLINFIDTASDPVVTMFALGYTKGVEPKDLEKSVAGLTKRFPNHAGVKDVVKQYKDFMAQLEAKKNLPAKPGIGDMAPEITMNDVDGKPFSLSELKGKYVLVDFWASWCGPCRGENPNVVLAYNKFKDKNFTVLGVSLDQDKENWLNAIKQDNLTWKHISDLKYWSSAAVPLYGFDAIPYNVLVDPTGKIIATELRENALQEKLAEVLK